MNVEPKFNIFRLLQFTKTSKESIHPRSQRNKWEWIKNKSDSEIRSTMEEEIVLNYIKGKYVIRNFNLGLFAYWAMMRMYGYRTEVPSNSISISFGIRFSYTSAFLSHFFLTICSLFYVLCETMRNLSVKIFEGADRFWTFRMIYKENSPKTHAQEFFRRSFWGSFLGSTENSAFCKNHHVRVKSPGKMFFFDENSVVMVCSALHVSTNERGPRSDTLQPKISGFLLLD